MARKFVIKDGVYIPLEEVIKRRKADVIKPDVISLTDMESQHLHEYTFREIRKFCSDKGIKYTRRDNRKKLMERIKLHYEEKV